MELLTAAKPMLTVGGFARHVGTSEGAKMAPIASPITAEDLKANIGASQKKKPPCVTMT
jgi:hypothetical protein